MTEIKKGKAKRPPVSAKRREQNRREFIRTSLLGAGVVTASMLGFLPVLSGAAVRVRPPGAIKDVLDEQEFFAACIKCGQCVQVCPVEAIKLGELDEGFGVGVPYIHPRDQACDFSCDGLQCVLACPTGALTHHLDFPADARMGFARLDRPKACLAAQGKGFKGQARGSGFKGILRYSEIDRWNPIPVADYPYDLELCDLCVRQCPIEQRIIQCEEESDREQENRALVAKRIGHECPPKHAIELRPVDSGDGVKRMRPTVLEGCVGCGVCEMICPVEGPAIVVDLDKTADTVGG
jgi:ferredoxin-type protein NapG